MEWHQAIEQIRVLVVKIITPQGHGTGFLIASQGNLSCIATAAHVVEYANYWRQPIRIKHAVSDREILLKYDDRAIDIDSFQDTASIIFSSTSELGFPQNPLSFTEEGKHYKEGVAIGWVEFPSIVDPDNLCFFHGRISRWEEKQKYYLVDGVAINGVSGGPAFYINSQPSLSNNLPGVNMKDRLIHIGLVSGYIPNQDSGVSMPGLCVIHDISHSRKSAKNFKNLADAREKAKTHATHPPTPFVPKSDS